MLQIPQEIIGLLPPLQHLGIAGYWFILLITFAEAFVFTGWVVPGTVLVVLAGGLAAHGVYDIGYLMVFATIGAILGDSVSYELGRRGRGIIARFVFLQKRVERGRAFFREHQGKSIFLGRFIGWIRPIVPFIAGLMGMKRIPFYIINILSAVAWAIAYLGLGYIFGAAGKIVLIGFAKISLILLLPSLPFVAIFFLWGLVLRRGKIILRVTISIVCSLGKGLRENEYVRRWLERHQRLSTFLHARISIATFQGLPLSLLLLATIYSFSIFSGLVEDYLTNAPLVALDVRLANLFYAFRDEELVQVFYAITALANVTTVLVAVLFLTGILWWQRRRITVATLWIAFLV